jgi:hypothetical protein
MADNKLDMSNIPARDALMRKKIARLEKRQAAFSQPITAEEIIYQCQYLEAVPYAGGFCWIYTSKSTSGRSKTYGKMSFRGFKVEPHRFALAVKLGCTLWDLENSKAGHAHTSKCLGGRCCKHIHLQKEDSTAAGAWARSRDKADVGLRPVRTMDQTRKMVRRTCNPQIPAHTQADHFPLAIGTTLLVGEGDAAFTITAV